MEYQQCYRFDIHPQNISKFFRSPPNVLSIVSPFKGSFASISKEKCPILSPQIFAKLTKYFVLDIHGACH